MAAPTVTRPVLGGQTGNSFSSNTTQPANSNIRYVSTAFEALDPTETPFVSLVGFGEEIAADKLEWPDDRLAPVSDALNGAINNSTTSVVVANVARFQQYQVIRIEAENMLVTAINDGSSTLTVTRAWGSTAAAHADATTVEIVATAFPQSTDISPAPVARGQLYYNYWSRQGYAIKVDYAENVTPNYLRQTPEYKKELEKKAKEAKIHLERSAFLGTRVAPSGALPGTFGGFPTFITEHVLAVASGDPLAEGDILDTLQASFDDVGEANVGLTVICRTFTKRVLSSWFSAIRYADTKTKRMSDVVDEYETDMGVLKFMNHHWCPPDSLYVIKPSNIQFHPRKGMAWFDEELAHAGPYYQGMLVGEYSLRAGGDRAHMKVTGFSTTRADYPSLNP